HLRAHSEWPNSMVVGRIMLPPESLANPGVSFRQKIEFASVPDSRGPVNTPNFGTAANMSILKDRYLTLGGFDQQMVGIEDQDFSIRYTTSGGRIVYLPEAVAVHYDDWLDFEGFCRRQEWASECTVRLRNRYPDMADGALRQAVNGPIRFLREPIGQTARKALKSAVSVGPGRIALFKGIATLERRAPESGLLRRMYKLALGAHLLKGYRKGLLKYGSNGSIAPAPSSKARKTQSSTV
ncbi:MAG: glycosyltransferase family 2 protein, partial [Blastocatellia bacterium]